MGRTQYYFFDLSPAEVSECWTWIEQTDFAQGKRCPRRLYPASGTVCVTSNWRDGNDWKPVGHPNRANALKTLEFGAAGYPNGMTSKTGTVLDVDCNRVHPQPTCACLSASWDEPLRWGTGAATAVRCFRGITPGTGGLEGEIGLYGHGRVLSTLFDKRRNPTAYGPGYCRTAAPGYAWEFELTLREVRECTAWMDAVCPPQNRR